MLNIDVTQEVLTTLREAADEIARLSGPENDVCRRLHELLGKFTPHSVTVGQLAKRIDVTPYDVLDAAISVGIKPFWHDGQQFRQAAYLRTYLRLESLYDPVREIKFELTAETARQLAEKLGVAPDELLPDSDPETSGAGSPPRKFVASEARWSGQAKHSVRRDQTG